MGYAGWDKEDYTVTMAWAECLMCKDEIDSCNDNHESEIFEAYATERKNAKMKVGQAPALCCADCVAKWNEEYGWEYSHAIEDFRKPNKRKAP